MMRHESGLILDWSPVHIIIGFDQQQLVIERDEAEWLFINMGHALKAQDLKQKENKDEGAD